MIIIRCFGRCIFFNIHTILRNMRKVFYILIQSCKTQITFLHRRYVSYWEQKYVSYKYWGYLEKFLADEKNFNCLHTRNNNSLTYIINETPKNFQIYQQFALYPFSKFRLGSLLYLILLLVHTQFNLCTRCLNSRFSMAYHLLNCSALHIVIYFYGSFLTKVRNYFVLKFEIVGFPLKNSHEIEINLHFLYFYFVSHVYRLNVS